MFIIPTDCVGGHLYKYLKQPHNHPFFWCVIEPLDMLNLINNWETLNFNNITIELSSKWNEWSTAKNTFDIIIDNSIRVHYVHNKLSMKDNVIRIHGGDTYYRYAYKLTYENYIRRLQRMRLEKKPTFLICENKSFGYTADTLSKICKSCDKSITCLTDKRIEHKNNTTLITIDSKIINTYKPGRTEYICKYLLKTQEFTANTANF